MESKNYCEGKQNYWYGMMKILRELQIFARYHKNYCEGTQKHLQVNAKVFAREHTTIWCP